MPTSLIQLPYRREDPLGRSRPRLAVLQTAKHLEIEMIVFSTFRIELRTASRTARFALHDTGGSSALHRRRRRVLLFGSIHPLARSQSDGWRVLRGNPYTHSRRHNTSS